MLCCHVCGGQQAATAALVSKLKWRTIGCRLCGTCSVATKWNCLCGTLWHRCPTHRRLGFRGGQRAPACRPGGNLRTAGLRAGGGQSSPAQATSWPRRHRPPVVCKRLRHARTHLRLRCTRPRAHGNSSLGTGPGQQPEVGPLQWLRATRARFEPNAAAPTNSVASGAETEGAIGEANARGATVQSSMVRAHQSLQTDGPLLRPCRKRCRTSLVDRIHQATPARLRMCPSLRARLPHLAGEDRVGTRPDNRRVGSEPAASAAVNSVQF